ncbi:M48 family metallopeptidase [Sphingomonas sp. AX6]|uniref:M48 family metallopeptidase n=1 Tax=Sphingomonas sp. AX6 TaxID=2653171 RepID=UPI001F4077EC|nr:M48 family metallopeptidase [Sphingomonas sp. AX6]
MAAVLISLCATPTRAQDGDAAAVFERVRAIDMRMASIGFRLATANAKLCRDLEPGTGVQLHTIDQYPSIDRSILTRQFGFDTRIAIAGVVEGSPAAEAGVIANESIASIGAYRTPAIAEAKEPTELVNRMYDQVAAFDPTAPLDFRLVADGRSRVVTVRPVAACRSRFEVDFANGFGAEADGRLVKIRAAFFDTYPDDRVAVVIAHELAHNVLDHRKRLNAVGVDRGLLAGFGRNVRYFRQTEVEADILAVHLLANAGYDPALAGQFWRDYGPKYASSLFNSRTHPAWRDRAARSDAEAARIAQGQGGALASAFVLRRDQRLDGDWQSLIAVPTAGTGG